MSAAPAFPARGRVYIAAVSLCGALALADSVRRMLAAPPEASWLIVAALTWISGAFAIKVPTLAATISISEVFVFTLAILFGCPAATITVAADGLLTSTLRRNLQPRRVLFNVAEPVVSTWVAARVYDAIGGPAPLSVAPAPLGTLVLPILVLAGVYLLLNTSLIAVAMAVETGQRAAPLWRRHIAWLSVDFMGGASIALLLTSNMRHFDARVLLLVVPLLFILHLVFSTWTERLKEAEQHVSEVNRLYLSTVEALAIAIESKDQVTHGHVRRVQSLSLAVARGLGVTDPLQLRAIEAAALLHDMGKVAIPDHILNKPGRLSEAEYELMKLHAPIGAEILSAVDFPYPVVPIVRHHHENWDGTGYPDGLAGQAIPLGARILSAVDCYDALTSDRPYRTALTSEEALRMIGERSGSMYDPAVTAALASLGPEPATKHDRPAVSVLIARANATSAPEPAPPAPTSAPLAVDWTQFDMAWPLLCGVVRQEETRSDVAASALAAFLRAVTPATTVCIGVGNVARQQLELVHVSGHGEQSLRGRTVLLGQGVSGWVAAHGRPMMNSDPALDFPREIAAMAPKPARALSVPIGDVGVLTLYTDHPPGFTAADRAVAERAARRLDEWLQGVGGEGLPDATLSLLCRAASHESPDLSLPRAPHGARTGRLPLNPEGIRTGEVTL